MVQLPTELGERLDTLAVKNWPPKEYYLQLIFENGISELEDYYLAAATAERICGGQEGVSSSASVREELGLDD